MANLLTDEVRREQYAKHRTQRIRCDKIFSITNWCLIIAAFMDLISTLLFPLFEKLASGVRLFSPLGLALSVIIYVIEFIGVYRRNLLLTLIAVLLSPLRMIISLSLFCLAVPMIVINVITMKKWQALSKEEGFPRFDIDFAERESRASKQAAITKHAAIESGKRRLAAPNAGEMSDLLDSEGDIPVASAELSGYHDRSRHGAAVTLGRQIAEGDMDDL